MDRLVVLPLFVAVVLALACAKSATGGDGQKIAKDADVPRISVADAKKEMDAGNAVIVDSRSETNFEAEHIAGSINIPFGSNNDAFAKLPQDKRIIVYCS